MSPSSALYRGGLGLGNRAGAGQESAGPEGKLELGFQSLWIGASSGSPSASSMWQNQARRVRRVWRERSLSSYLFLAPS